MAVNKYPQTPDFQTHGDAHAFTPSGDEKTEYSLYWKIEKGRSYYLRAGVDNPGDWKDWCDTDEAAERGYGIFNELIYLRTQFFSPSAAKLVFERLPPKPRARMQVTRRSDGYTYIIDTQADKAKPAEPEGENPWL